MSKACYEIGKTLAIVTAFLIGFGISYWTTYIIGSVVIGTATGIIEVIAYYAGLVSVF